MVETNDERSNQAKSTSAAKEVTKPANNNLTPAARKLRLILSSRALLIMKKTMILEALNQAENEAEAKVEAALAREDDLKPDNDNNNDNDNDNDKEKDNDNPPNPSMSFSDRAESPFAAVQVDEVNQAQAAIRSLKRTSVQAAESPANGHQNLPALGAPSTNVPPPKTTSTVITTCSGRVVQPSQKARELNEAADKKKTSTSEAATRTRTRTRTRSGKGGKGGATRPMSAPPAATVNTTITRSGRVVKPR